MQIEIESRVKYSFLIVCLSIFVFACGSDSIDEAAKSITGEWNVKEIYSAYGVQMHLGIEINSDTTEQVTGGTFVFQEDRISSYYYNRLDTLYAASNLEWELTKLTENCGFTQCDVYYIDLDGRTFKCEFGDQTNDAHVNATEIKLISETTQIGPYRQIIFSLEKN